jgi:hypothetical protein
MKRLTNFPHFGHPNVLTGSDSPEVILCRLSRRLLTVVLAGTAAVNTPAEIVFQDFFTQTAGNVTNSVPWIDVEGNGWRSGAVPSQLALDGDGHLYNGVANAAATAGIQLIPIGPHGSMTASALLQLPVGSTESIDFGFGNSNQFLSVLASESGPWVQVFGTGAITLYGGAGLNNPATLSRAFTNAGGPVQILLTYDAFHATASVGIVSGGATNLIFDRWPVTNSLNSIAAKYLIFQFSTNFTTPTARWATAATVDWIPRPPPMLTLPVPITNTVLVGSPDADDVRLIQRALNSVSNVVGGTEIRFSAGATYVITNSSLIDDIPLSLQNATNVLVNGNGCKILITNPRIGFLNVVSSSNVIVQGFTVDYDPLPYTQGTVTHNFYTGGDVPKEWAIEFLVDKGYPSPTNANYVGSKASGLWGTVMDPVNLGRGADGSYAACLYTNVMQTNSNGAFKVYLSFPAVVPSIQPSNLWNMVSRWNASDVFKAFQSYQITFLNNTNYTGAGPSYRGQYTPLICEINDQILLGQPPAGATAPRLRTSNADGGLFGDSRIGPWVQGCNFTGLSDDLANATLAPFVVTNAPIQPTNTFAVFFSDSEAPTPISLLPYQAQVGDAFLFFNAITGEVFDRATITAVDLPNITFDHAISNVVAGTYDTNTLLVNQSLNTSAVYLDNQFSNGRQHGIYCRANNTLIAHNTISGMSLGAISGFPAMNSTFLNLFVPTNVVIMDNVLSDCSFSEEALSNAIPTQEPAYGLVEFHNATINSHYVTNGLDISGLRILYNAFLNWRRAPLSLHNATDVNVSGNYFGPPLTNDGYVPLAEDVIADLWACDYPNVRFTNNVNATTLPENQTINEDGTLAAVPAHTFELPVAPRLAANLSGNDLVVTWASPSPGFVLQQVNGLSNGSNNWLDATNTLLLAGASNNVTLALPGTVTNQFYRVRQR